MAAENDAGTAERVPPPQVTMGLLPYLTAYSLDQDYADVHRRRVSRGAPSRSRLGVAALLVLALFGLLVATAAVETSRDATDSRDSHDSLVRQVQQRGARLDARRSQANALRSEIAALQAEFLQDSRSGRALQSRLRMLGVQSGAAAVHGPGVRVVVDDAPHPTSDTQRVLDADLQKLVNGLWQSGAEAISINGERLSSLSAIRQAGSAITVNYTSLTHPYRVAAIGNRNQLQARFVDTPSGGAWLDLQAVYGLRFTMTPEESLQLPAASRLTLRYAHAAGGRR